MFAQLVAGTSLTMYPILGLIIFFAFTVFLYLWAFNPRRRQLFIDLAQQALSDSPRHNPDVFHAVEGKE